MDIEVITNIEQEASNQKNNLHEIKKLKKCDFM